MSLIPGFIKNLEIVPGLRSGDLGVTKFMDGKSPPHSGISNKQTVSLSNLNFSLYCDFLKIWFDFY